MAIYLQRHMEVNRLWKWVHADFLLALVGFMVMLGEICGSSNFQGSCKVALRIKPNQ